ncbi:tyrosine-type recombinase/integrase [Pantoea agglomerans]|uniref:Site-specific integrase n=1 Tax=Enterobacter agglomerans TaxID=549 RepID=A0AAN2K7D9_ENTAG|nr:site-specific integrase [Pantoea agglomerans]CAH6335455.1 site-specific integrase [Pantoea agglomerans]
MNEMNADWLWKELLDEYFFCKSLREDTEWSYQKVVRGFRKHIGEARAPYSITSREVLEWRRHVLKKQGLSAHTWNNKVTHMRALYNFAITSQLTDFTKNPFSGVSVKHDKKRKKTLTKNQMTKIWLTMQQFSSEQMFESKCALRPVWYWLAVLDTLRYTGMRQNQLLHIRLKDVCLEDGWIELRTEGSKTYREWRVPVVSHLRSRLEGLLQRARDCGAGNNDALFHYERFVSSPADRASLSEKPSLQPLRSFFRRLSKECGFDISPHRFRHTLATTLMSSPERNLQLVKGLLGHRNVSTTMEYVDISMDIVSKALEKEMALYTDKAEEMFYNG